MPRRPKAEADKYKSVTISLRPRDVKVLQRLAVERVTSAPAGASASEAWDALFERGERPSVSLAVRYLVDAEFERRSRIAFKVCKQIGWPTDALEVVLEFDPVFGSRGPTTPSEKRFVTAYLTELSASRELQKTVMTVSRRPRAKRAEANEADQRVGRTIGEMLGTVRKR